MVGKRPVFLALLLAAASGPVAAAPDALRLSPELQAPAAMPAAARLRSPIPGASITSDFGWRVHPLFKKVRFHGGIDFGAPRGTQVLSAAAGVVERIRRTRDRGLCVTLRHGTHLQTQYSHLATLAPGIVVGRRMAMQQPLGTVGNSGWSTGPHLDFAAYVDGGVVDPAPLLEATEPAGASASGAIVLQLSEAVDLTPLSF